MTSDLFNDLQGANMKRNKKENNLLSVSSEISDVYKREGIPLQT
jgi:hypothetical protein